jgi:RNA methyltransferase, TrmH family
VFVVEGPVLIAEAVAAGWEIEVEFVAPGVEPVSGAPSFGLADGVLERVADTESPQGSIAVVRMPERTVDLAPATFVVVLDRLADPGNLGTLLRSAEAAGVDAVVLTPGSVDVYNPKVVRASAGALFHVPAVIAELAEVGDAGLRVVGTSSHRGTPSDRADWSGRIALVLGNEAHGLPDDAPVDLWVTIEHRGRAESLNVAMAGTVVLFDAARSR